MCKEIITFDDTEIEKLKFYQQKSPISIGDVDINNMIVSNRVSFGKKSFKFSIGHKSDRKARLLCIMLPKMSAYKRDFDETKYIFFLSKIMNC